MRPALALVLQLSAAAVTTCVVGCTFLISFDDVPDAGATGDEGPLDSGKHKPSSSSSSSGESSSSSSSSGESSSSSSSSSSSGGATFPPPCDTTVALAQIDCGTTTGGSACANELPANASLQGSDLVECDATGKATCVRHCTMGCSANPGLPSQCANCLDKNNADIWYCGKQMGWTTEASDVAIHCSNGKMVDTPASCGKDLCHKTCTRTSPPPLPGACCQSTPE